MVTALSYCEPSTCEHRALRAAGIIQVRARKLCTADALF